MTHAFVLKLIYEEDVTFSHVMRGDLGKEMWVSESRGVYSGVSRR